MAMTFCSNLFAQDRNSFVSAPKALPGKRQTYTLKTEAIPGGVQDNWVVWLLDNPSTGNLIDSDGDAFGGPYRLTKSVSQDIEWVDNCAALRPQFMGITIFIVPNENFDFVNTILRGGTCNAPACQYGLPSLAIRQLDIDNTDISPINPCIDSSRRCEIAKDKVRGYAAAFKRGPRGGDGLVDLFGENPFDNPDILEEFPPYSFALRERIVQVSASFILAPGSSTGIKESCESNPTAFTENLLHIPNIVELLEDEFSEILNDTSLSPFDKLSTMNLYGVHASAANPERSAEITATLTRYTFMIFSAL